MSELSDREQELVALAAAVASNCVPCVEFHVPEARRVGVSDTQMREAVRLADRVRRVPARKVLKAALTMLEEKPRTSAAPTTAVCGCSESHSKQIEREVEPSL
jgi:4-carboxymuconolactone decarboxylase